MKLPSSRDQLYVQPLEQIVDFDFDESVAGVFPDMIQRSVPGYAAIIAMIGIVAQQVVRPATQCYDLGCSVGAATLAMQGRIEAKDCHIIAVDNSPAMLARAQENLSQPAATSVEFVCSDVRSITIENASLVVINFTLQFIPLEQRDAVISHAYHGLNDGGVLILSEKIAFDDPRQQQAMTELHHAFKRANGYSELEISQKRSALEKVLIPETLTTHTDRLQRAGFSSILTGFQCFNFVSLIAYK